MEKKEKYNFVLFLFLGIFVIGLVLTSITFCSAIAFGNPKTDLNFMMSPSIENVVGNSLIDANNFDECPIVLNDYGATTEKCESWGCTGFATATNGRGGYCTGGWNCSRWNGVTCAEYRCSAWTSSATARREIYCSAGWNCSSWNGGVCQNWDCLGYSLWTVNDQDRYCAGTQSCLAWFGNSCLFWNCTNWQTYPTIVDTDHFCAGTWNCLSYNNSICDSWNCSSWGTGVSADTFDWYCNGSINCTAWNNGICESWNCTSRIAASSAGTERDAYCSGIWNCTNWNETSKVCESWTCSNWALSGTDSADFYCSGSFNCTVWKTFSYPILINFTFPTETGGTYLDRNSILINVSVTSSFLSNVTIFLYNSSRNLVNSTNSTTSPLFINFTGPGNGIYYFNATACDSLNQCNSTETRNVTIDLIKPSINFTFPTETSGTYLDRNSILINVTANDTYLKNITIFLYNSSRNIINFTNSTTSPLFINFTGLVSGLYFFNATTYDLAGNINSTETRNISIDTDTPLINFTSPTESSGSYVNRNFILINVSASDSFLANITINLYNITSLVNSTTTLTSPNYANISGLAEGIYFFNASARDLVNRVNYTETRNVTLDRTTPLISYGTNTLANGVNVSQNFVYINVSVTEINEANITFRLYNLTSNVNTTTFTTAVRIINFTNLSDGTYFYNVTVRDKVNLQNTTQTYKIVLDRTAPNATLTSPANGSYSNSSSNNFTANISDNLSGIQNVTLNIYNSTDLVNQTTTLFTGTVNTIIGTVVTLADNVYTWFYSLFDFAGNQFVGGNNTVTVDTVYPGVNFTSPTPASAIYSNVNSILINISSSDLNSIYSLNNFDNSLLSLWRLERGNGTFFVSDSGLNNGSCFGVSCPTFTTLGKFGGAYNFDAVNNFVDAGTATTMNFISTNDYAFSVWVKLVGVGSDGVGGAILGKYSAGSGYRLSSFNDSRGLYFQSNSNNFTSNYQLNLSVWYHIVYSKNSTGQYFFVNGNQIANDSIDVLSASASNFYIGTYTSPPTSLFNGTIDEVIAFNRSLSLSEVKSLYDSNTNKYINNFTNLSDGLHVYRGSVVDSAGNKNSTETRNITIDTISPNVNFTSPTESSGSYANKDYVLINATANDANFANITINLYNVTSLVNSTNTITNNNFVNISGLAEGIYFFNSTSEDLANNKNSTETRNITLDTTYPLISYGTNTLANGVNVSQNFVYINVSVTELNEANITFRLYNLTSNINTTTLVAGIRIINFTNLSDGIYFYNVTVGDKVNLQNTTERYRIVLDRTAPNATLISPANASYSNANSNNFTANISDNLSGIQNVTLNIYNSTDLVNQTTTLFTGTVNTIIGTVVTLADNVYTWFYSLFDFAGNQFVSGNNSIIVDTTRPGVFGFIPLANSSYNISNVIEIGVNVTDVNLVSYVYASITYSNSTIQNISLVLASGNKYNTTFTVPNLIGRFNISFFANDSAGNINQSETTYFIAQDNIFPNGSFVSPTPLNGSTSGINTTTFKVVISENIALDTCILEFDGQNQTMNSSVNGFGFVCNVTKTNIIDGQHNFTVYFNDSSGNINQTRTRTYLIDRNFPDVAFVDPTETTDSYISRSNIIINVTATSLTPINNLSIYLYNLTSLVNTSFINDSKNFVNFTNLSDGIYLFNASSDDNLSRTGWSETRTVTIDTIKPSINFTAPTETSGTYVNRNYILFNVTANDTNFLNISIEIFDSIHTFYDKISNTNNIFYLNYSGASDDIYFFNATVYDLANNKNSTETRNVTLDTTAPIVEYGFGTLANGVNVSQNFVYINVSVTEINEANITFRLYNLTSNVNTTTFTTAVRIINFTNLSDGTYFYNVTVRDKVNLETTSLTYKIVLDRTAPNATLISPANASYSNASSNNFTANISDNLSGIQNVTLNIYNSTDLVNQTTTFFTGTVNTIIGTVVTLADNVYTWFYSLFDFAGNEFTTANNTISVDTIIPLISFGTGTEANNAAVARDNIFVNVSVVELNEANITFNLYNTTGLVLSNFYSTPIRIINWTGLATGVYYYNVTIYDLANNKNSTETRTIGLGMVPPVISNILYTPNTTREIDPGINISFSANVTAGSGLIVNTVILQYYNGTSWSNATMNSIGGTFYQVNITLISSETNYTFNVYANDSAGNNNHSINSTFVSAWDCSWTLDKTTLGSFAGFNENKFLDTILINNTGDASFSNNNCTLDFRFDYDFAAGRIYIDNSATKPSNTYSTDAGNTTLVNINASFLDVSSDDNGNILVNEISVRSDVYNKNITVNLVSTTGNQPYLYQTISSVPSSLALRAQDFSLFAYVKNLVGDGSLAKSAYNVSFNWSLPSSFLIKVGTSEVFYPIILDNLAHHNDLLISFNSTNLPSMTPGNYTVYLYASGLNISGNSIIMSGNNTLLVQTMNITLSCSSIQDNILVTACGSLDGDSVSVTVPPTVAGAGGGGGGGIGSSGEVAKVETLSQTIEIIRGTSDTFEITVENKYANFTLEDVTITLTGFLAQYISIDPNRISSIKEGEKGIFTITLKVPSYKESYEDFILTAIIKGNLVKPGSSTRTSFTQTRNINLTIQEISHQESNNSLQEAEKALAEMIEANFNADEASRLLAQARVQFNNNRNRQSQIYSELIINLKNKAFETDLLLRKVIIVLNSPRKMGLLTGSIISEDIDRTTPLRELLNRPLSKNVSYSATSNESNLALITGLAITAKIEEAVYRKYPEIRELLELAITAFERGDFNTAEERTKNAESILILELKGNILLFLYFYWQYIFIGLVVLLIILIVGYRGYQKLFISSRIMDIHKEEENIRELMRDLQNRYFTGKISSGDYHRRMGQSQNRLSKLNKQMLTLRNRRISLLKSEEINKELKLESGEVENQIKRLQEHYYKNKNISENEYKREFQMENERLAEIEGERTTLELLQHTKKSETSFRNYIMIPKKSVGFFARLFSKFAFNKKQKNSKGDIKIRKNNLK